jgi:hypothetical protein
MSRKLTWISLPGSSYHGFGDNGEVSPDKMIAAAREESAGFRKMADEIDAAADGEFEVYVANGVHVRRGQKVLQKSSRPQSEV